MYTDEMRQEFHLIKPPGDFKIDLYDNEQFITIVVNPDSLVDITEEDGKAIVAYITEVKTALEKHGALVLVVREVLEDSEHN